MVKAHVDTDLLMIDTLEIGKARWGLFGGKMNQEKPDGAFCSVGCVD